MSYIDDYQEPVFTTPLENIDYIEEGYNAHFDCRLIPVGDPHLKVEWFLNNRPLRTGSRFLPINDFGYVALDIQHTQAEDSGVYMVRASNEIGEAVTTAIMRVKSKAAIQFDSQIPEVLPQLQALERNKYIRNYEEPDKIFNKPVFTTPLIGPDELIEGEAAHFECQAMPLGDSDLTFTWYLNGRELITGSRFATSNDFGYITLDIASTIPEDSGIYIIRAKNKSGEAIATKSLRVKGEAVIDMQCQLPNAFRQTPIFQTEWDRIENKIEEPFDRPVFTELLSNEETLKEGQYLYIEARIEPASDDRLRIEWYKNGRSLVLGSRITTRFEFGLISLEIIDLIKEDSGIYTCRAVNRAGEAFSTCDIKVQGEGKLQLSSMHPESWQKIQEIEKCTPVKKKYKFIRNTPS